MGIEEVTANFHYGLAESVSRNPVSDRGHPTSLKLNPKSPLVVNYIMGVALIPPGFDRVKEIEPTSDSSSVILRSRSGKSVKAPLDIDFIRGA
jgi:hypothetical protein